MKSFIRPKQIAALVVMTVMILKPSSVECRDPVLHRVGGGKSTWNPNTHFSDWSSHENFFVGDWLYFGFDKRIYNVLEVNTTSYANCDDTTYITNVTRGGRDVFNLSEAKTYYFLCGRGFCFQGMRLQVSVIEIPPTPAPHTDLKLSHALLSHSHAFYAQIMLATSLLLLLA